MIILALFILHAGNRYFGKQWRPRWKKERFYILLAFWLCDKYIYQLAIKLTELLHVAW